MAGLRILATNDFGGAFVPQPASWGVAGTFAGVETLLARERARQPAIWLDSGDLTVGAVHPLLGDRRWDELAALPIAAAAAGNHEFDDGVPALQSAAARLSFPLLCANLDAGLPPSAVVETEAGPLGVIGLTHPRTDRHAGAPPLAGGWTERVEPVARELRAGGARWVVALLHDGVTWWPTGDGIATRADRLARVARPWARSVDLVLGAHTLGAWTGELAGTPAGHGFPFGGSVLVAELRDPPERAVVHGTKPIPAVEPAGSSQAAAGLRAAASEVVAHSEHTWLTRTGAPHYLPRLVADAFRAATGADAAIVPAGQHATQAPVDGALSAVRAGPVSRLDLLRLFNYEDDHLVVFDVEPGELRAALAVYAANADPRNVDADDVWWNVCRMPAGVSAATPEPRTVAALHWVAPRIGEWLGRELDPAPAGIGGRDAVLRGL